MKEIGCAENSAVDSVVSTLSMEDLEKAANKAGLKVELSVWGLFASQASQVLHACSPQR